MIRERVIDSFFGQEMGSLWADVYEFCKSVHWAISISEVRDELRQTVTDCGKEMMTCVVVDCVLGISAGGITEICRLESAMGEPSGDA